MLKSSKFRFSHLVTLVGMMLILTTFTSAQESVVGTITFYPGGSTRTDQLSNSEIALGGHTLSCAFNASIPVWHASDIQNGKNPTIATTNFGPCTIDGVLIRDVALIQMKTGVLLTINMVDGKCWSLMLVNSAGIRLTDLTGIYFKGPYAANSAVGFNLIGNVQ